MAGEADRGARRRPLGAQIAYMLRARGVEVVFGIPGVHNVEMYRGLEGAGLTHVLARHEQGAGFMADGYARASGKPGVAFVITGPGLTNMMTALGQAWSDSVPVLAISASLDEAAARRGQLHQMRDQRGAAACVCDWSEEARTPEAAYALIDRALDEFSAARPRPRHVQVPIALAGTPADPAPPRTASARPARPVAAPDQVARAAAMLAGARRPLLILGGGVVASAGWQAARRVMRRLGAAAFCTYAARGVIPPGEALSFGAFLPRPESAAIIGSADVVLVVGSALAEVDLWRADPGIRGRLIRVDIDPAELTTPRADLAILGDAAWFLEALDTALQAEFAQLRGEDATSETAPRPETGWTAEEVARARAAWRAAADAERPGIAPVIAAVARAMPPEAMIYSDMTQFAYLAKELWEMDRPGHWHHPTGFGTLGYALPAAIGGAVARGGAAAGGGSGGPVAAIAGDYGFQYTMQELGTAVELGLSLPIILWDNGKLKEIEDSMIASQISPNAVVARNPDFLALARAYGARVAEPVGAAAISAALQEAFCAGVPTLIRLTPQSLP